jgi:hypothetical protein
MAGRPNEVYKGSHKKRGIAGAVLFILAVLLVGAVVMFYSFQKYLVYGQDGVKLELPILASAAPAAESGSPQQSGDAQAELVVDQPDYSSVATTADGDTPALCALFVPAESVTDEGIKSYQDKMSAWGATGLVLEVRPDSGQLVYASQVSTASSYGLGGTYDLRAKVAELKEAGIYLAAQINCCADNLLASRNPPIALHNAFGGVFTDEDGNMWLDPYNPDTRSYAAALVRELSEMGFDEVLLRGAEMPITDQMIVYSQTMSFTPTPVSAVSGFVLSVARATASCTARVSAVLDSETLHGALTEVTGQDAELFFKLFDRVCCWADSAWQYGVDGETFAPYVTVGDAAARYTPVVTYVPEGARSWVLKIIDYTAEGAG